MRAVIRHRPQRCRNNRLRAAPESADAAGITVAQEQCRRQLKTELRQLVTRYAGLSWVSSHRACMQHRDANCKLTAVALTVHLMAGSIKRQMPLPVRLLWTWWTSSLR